ncbi:hypothetical protein DDB_G0270570 [Dictyostelium discoideum AX4]|uniref:Uncharacterized protein n=1 Tax=Dictyostelium discoideum TaxID=44689 RepID=Q55DN0_DICDI|nr:hypothetical protein DDB_G0270570 [Dictyostelium discoideum AX4]EAL72635.1 hypothetical protein DDB_G0270570 [Dictyostelium discoideum AX4]|eukprot:XP_646101.1 hypothetical protein DDB_G0270570 [Dictyostelium discoideum AX4]
MTSNHIKKQIEDIKNLIKNNIDILINETYKNQQNECNSNLLEKEFIKINNQTYNKYETSYKEELIPFINEKDYIDTIEIINEFPAMARKQFYRYVKTVIGIHIGVLVFLLFFFISKYEKIFFTLLILYILSVLFFILCCLIQKKLHPLSQTLIFLFLNYYDINILIKNYFHILNEKFENLGLVFKCEWIPKPIEKSNEKFIQQEITIFYPLLPLESFIAIDINTLGNDSADN